MIPTLDPLASLRFAYDPPALLLQGRRAARRSGAPAWRFWLGGQVVTVVAGRATAEIICRSPALRFFRGEALEPLLGPASPLLASGAAHARGRALVQRVLEAPLSFDVRGELWCEAVARASLADGRRLARAGIARLVDSPAGVGVLHRLAGRGLDVAPALRRAMLRAILRSLGAPDAALRATLTLLWCADRPALMVPALRPLSPPWWLLARSRRALLSLLQVDDPATQDAVITLLVGAADNPVILALWSLVEPDREPGDLAFCRPAVPLVLREAIAPLELPALGLALAPGDAVGVDVEISGAPYGGGKHGCPGARLSVDFARHVRETMFELDLVADPDTVRVGRRLLGWGPRHLIVRTRRSR